MRGRKSSVAIVPALVILAPAPAGAELADIWAVSDGTKVAAGDLEHPLSRGNLTFDREERRISVAAARNETVAFQVILEGGEEPTEVRFHLDPGLAPEAQVSLFREHYLTVEERSHDLYWSPGTAAQPTLRGKTIPDALVPLEPGGSIEVPARTNRAVWVDVYVPKGAPAGEVRGGIRLEVPGGDCSLAGCRLAVELEVRDFSLPDRTSARTMVWFSGGPRERDLMAARYFDEPWEAPEEEVAALRRRHFHMARRHRLTFFIGQDDEPTAELRRRLTGESFSRAAGYRGPGEGLPQDLYVIHAYGAAELAPDEARAWSTWLGEVAPHAEVLYYTLDEPAAEEFAEVNRRARQAEPVPSFTTAPYQEGLDVDVYAALPSHYTAEAAAAAREDGKEMWVYNGVRPFSGTFVVDDVAVSPRVNAWIQHRAGIGRWFFWEATYYKDAQGGRGQIDVFGQADNFGNPHGDRGNGDGLLVYPGSDKIFPARDLGLDRPIPSIRLKNWRRGLEDVEYLELARARGHGAFVDELLEALLPAYLAGELEADDPVPWSESGETWLRARRLVAEAIETGREPPIPEELRSELGGWGATRVVLTVLVALALALGLAAFSRRGRR